MSINSSVTESSLAKKFKKNLGLSLLSKIPVFGDMISSGASAWIEMRDEEKMNEMLNLIVEELNQLSEEKIDLKYLESPEFTELISQILKR